MPHKQKPRRPAGAFAAHPGTRSEAEVEAAAHDVESSRVETRRERVQAAGYGERVAAEIDVQILRPDRPVSRQPIFGATARGPSGRGAGGCAGIADRESGAGGRAYSDGGPPDVRNAGALLDVAIGESAGAVEKQVADRHKAETPPKRA